MKIIIIIIIIPLCSGYKPQHVFNEITEHELFYAHNDFLYIAIHVLGMRKVQPNSNKNGITHWLIHSVLRMCGTRS